MTSANSTHDHLSDGSDPALHTALTVTSAVALFGCVVGVVTRLTRYVIPTGWKCCLLCQDLACLSVSLGVVLTSAFVGGADLDFCRAAGFFTMFGILDLVSAYTLTALTFLVIQNPSKMSQLSNFRWRLLLALLIPQKVVTFVLATLPVMPLDYFDTTSPYPVACFPIRQEGEKGATFGAIFFFILWGVLTTSLSLCVVVAVRLWAGSGRRVHASAPSLWQMQKMEQGRGFHKFTMLETALVTMLTFLLTIVVYSNSDLMSGPQWIVLSSLVVVAVVHGVMSVVQLCVWSSVCCDRTGQKKEPHHRLKQLQLIRIEGPGKLRMKASWSAGKGVWRQGLLKVYGPAHIKSWAQEIVVLGLLRKSGNASVLQCLWTSNTNPYCEAMTLISGDIVTGDSRLTCLELTSSGTLHELLKTMRIPLPEPCQRTIMHDVAEGLSFLHQQNVLHRNLTSAAVYLKGSVKCLVLRAAVGDFEDAQIYGTVLTGSPTSAVSRNKFFLPDIRAFALVGLDMLGHVCQYRQRDRQPHRRTALKLNVEPVKDKSKKAGQLVSQHREKAGDNPELSRKQIGVKRFDRPEVPYCAPGEAEYLVKSSQEKASGQRNTDNQIDQIPSESVRMSPQLTNDLTTVDHRSDEDNRSENIRLAEYNIDHNWKLQMRASDGQQSSDWRGKEWSDSDPADQYKAHEDRFHHSQVPGITQVKGANSFEFPNYSVFKAAENKQEDLEMIEEEIEYGRHLHVKNRGSKAQPAGYITSRTQDGREIFVPAASFTSKSSLTNSSSGYGSCAPQSDHQSSVGSVSGQIYSATGQHKVHKTTSAATISSFEDDILEVLPGVADVGGKISAGERLLKEWLTARKEARLEELVISYEERVKNGELGTRSDNLPEGVVFPKKNKAPGLVPSTSEQARQEDHNPGVTAGQENKLSSPRAKSAMSSLSHRLQRTSQRPVTAGSSWHARSSLKRNKARVALKKALGDKKMHTFQALSNQSQVTGRTPADVERKYANRPSPAKPDQRTQLTQANEDVQKTSEQKNDTQMPTFLSATPQATLPAVETNNPITALANLDTTVKSANDVNNSKVSRVTRKPSAKHRPAPPPPTSVHTAKLGRRGFSSFGSYDTNTAKSFNPQNESFTSVEPASTQSESVNNSSGHSQAQSSVDRIESDMNTIIQGETAQAPPTQLTLPPGLRLIDSGFDSSSVTSEEEETCLCAASALQTSEDGGSCSCPSQRLSQSTCTCACSNCLGGAPGVNSWTESQDSESWSNSNSFSSYDANMYRRKLPSKTKGQNSPGCVLAPDEQYPSPASRGHRRPSASSLHPYSTYSPKRNRRRLAPTRGNYGSSASDSSSAASQRYRELIRKGVPLRVSVIPGDGQGGGDLDPSHDLTQSGVHMAESEFALDNEDLGHTRLYTDLENQGFFNNNLDLRARGVGEMGGKYDRKENQELSPIPSLEEIIKEIPDETGHFSDEANTFLNRPDSELSVKALQAVLSRHGSSTEGKTPQPNELLIDRIFAHGGPSDSIMSSFSLQSGQEMDEAAIREVSLLPSNDMTEPLPLGMAGLLTGMDGRHVRYCHSISTRLHLIKMNELLPASVESFDTLRTKLQLAGSIGSIGNQILELIRSCWLQESPPTTAAIVDQLTDRVTETEL